RAAGPAAVRLIRREAVGAHALGQRRVQAEARREEVGIDLAPRGELDVADLRGRVHVAREDAGILETCRARSGRTDDGDVVFLVDRLEVTEAERHVRLNEVRDIEAESGEVQVVVARVGELIDQGDDRDVFPDAGRPGRR